MRSRTMRCMLLGCALVLFASAAARGQYPDKQAFEVIEHGRYMATAADCTACHTAPGGKPFAGGGALETPFGTLLAPNITPDIGTGIGGWAVDQFVDAVRRAAALVRAEPDGQPPPRHWGLDGRRHCPLPQNRAQQL